MSASRQVQLLTSTLLRNVESSLLRCSSSYSSNLACVAATSCVAQQNRTRHSASIGWRPFVNNQLFQRAGTLQAPFVQARFMPCSAGLDRPPPQSVNIIYDPAEVDRFIAIADHIEDELPALLVNGEESTEAEGVFKVTTEDGDVLFDSAAHQRFPTADELLLILQEQVNIEPRDASVGCM